MYLHNCLINISLIRIIILMGKILIALFILTFSIIGTIGCNGKILPPPEVPAKEEALPDNKTHFNEELLLQDERFINSMYNREDRPKYPGYSLIEVLNREGEGTGINPRILTIRVTLESYPTDIVCEGEFYYFRGDPAFARTDWYSLEGVIHKRMVNLARHYLRYTSGPVTCQNKLVLLVLKRWIDEGLIELHDIKDARVIKAVKDLMENPVDLPNSLTDTGLVNTSEIQTYDLVPELPDNEKTPVYVLRSNGILELYLKDPSIEIREVLKLQSDACDFILANPIPKPSE
jgi:hypothetical protein